MALQGLPHTREKVGAGLEQDPMSGEGRQTRSGQRGPVPPASNDDVGPIDPLLCAFAAPPILAAGGAVSAPQASTTGLPPADLQTLILKLSRRVAWGGDRRRGSARIELGEGALSGATLVVHTHDNEVSVELELPPGGSAHDWQRRLSERLERRGLTVGRITVR
jgi:hypothetical protein